jgi:large subunit ribosomal protein L24
MKKEFSKSWIGSRQPRKQRKYLANAPLHIRHKLLSVHLSKELRKKYGKRNFPVRKGDAVKVFNGEYKKKTGKIAEVNMGKLKVLIDGIYKSKKDGTKIKVYFQPSNLMIQELNLDDKKRLEALNRKSSLKKTLEKKVKASSLDKSIVKDRNFSPEISAFPNKSRRNNLKNSSVLDYNENPKNFQTFALRGKASSNENLKIAKDIKIKKLPKEK